MSGAALRLGRLFRKQTGRSFIVALDHGVVVGVPPGAENLPEAVARCILCEPEGISLSPGMAQLAADQFAHRGAPALLVRSDFIVQHPSLDELGEQYRVLVSPSEIAALGGDAVLMFLMVGTSNGALFADNVASVSRAAQEAHRVGLPLIVEVVLWGTRVKNQKDPDRLAFGCRIASELGADAIKTEFTGDVASMKQIVDSCSRPVFVLGGSKGDETVLLNGTRTAIAAGAKGVIIGRNVWQAEDPPAIAARLRAIIHGELITAQPPRPSVAG